MLCTILHFEDVSEAYIYAIVSALQTEKITQTFPKICSTLPAGHTPYRQNPTYENELH